MISKITLWFLILSPFYSIAQKPTYIHQSNPDLNIKTLLSGVQYAQVRMPNEIQEALDGGSSDGMPICYQRAKDYLMELGFKYVALTTTEKEELYNKVKSHCEVVNVEFDLQYRSSQAYGYYGIVMTNVTFTSLSVTFTSCNGDEFIFKTDKPGWSSGMASNCSGLVGRLKYLYTQPKINYNAANQLTLSAAADSARQKNVTGWNEDSIKTYFTTQSHDNMEGIYENVRLSSDAESKYKIGLVRNTVGGYDVIYLGGPRKTLDWAGGEIKGRMYRTANSGLYKADWYMSDKKLVSDAYFTVNEDGLLTLTLTGKYKKEYTFIKLFPSGFIAGSNDVYSSTGSGIVISTDGYIVTNSHVVSEQGKIRVEIGGNTYGAKIVVNDKTNDLAIIKIDDPAFVGFPPLPFYTKTSQLDVGSPVIALGFPMTSTMGKEMKATDGIISAKSGYEGNICCYQISAPVQPGNSGGPMFDKNGNLVGIVNAKHVGASNVSYAIKTSYLLSLMEMLPTPIELPKNTMLASKPLSDQIKILQNYVAFIKIQN